MPVEWYADEGVSAYRDVRRPDRDRLMADVRAGDVVAVVRLDRLARSVVDLLEIVKIIDKRRAALVFIDQGIDTSGPFGRFILVLLAALAEPESSIVSDRQTGAIAHARSVGRHYGKKPTCGWCSVFDEERQFHVLRPDPVEAPRLRDALLNITRGASVKATARGLGIGEGALRYTMANPRLIGRLPGGKLDPESAILTAREWQALQERLKAGKRGPFGTAPVFGRALRCECGQRLYLNTARHKAYGGTYTCRGEPIGITHTSVRRDIADEWIEAQFLERHGDDRNVVGRMIQPDTKEVDEDAALIELEIEHCIDSMRSPDADIGALSKRLLELRAEESQLANRAPAEPRLELIDTGVTMRQRWDMSDEEHRGAMILQVATVVAHPGRGPSRLEWVSHDETISDDDRLQIARDHLQRQVSQSKGS